MRGAIGPKTVRLALEVSLWASCQNQPHRPQVLTLIMRDHSSKEYIARGDCPHPWRSPPLRNRAGRLNNVASSVRWPSRDD